MTWWGRSQTSPGMGRGVPRLPMAYHPFRQSSSPIRYPRLPINSYSNNIAPRLPQGHRHRGNSRGYGQRYTFQGHRENVHACCTSLERQLKSDIQLLPPGNEPRGRKRIPLTQMGYEQLWIEFEKLNETKVILSEIHSRISLHEHVDVGIVKPETFRIFAIVIGSADIEMRCLACSVLNLIFRRDVQADAYCSIFLQKERSWVKLMIDVLRLENLGDCKKALQLTLLSEICSLIYIACSTNSLNSKALIQGGVVDCLINLLKGDSVLFQFDQERRIKVTKEIGNKKLKAKMIAIDSDDAGCSYLLYDLCYLENEASIPIKECISKPGMLWEDGAEQLTVLRKGQDLSVNDESECREICVTAVISPSKVFAHINEASVNAVKEIERTLSSYVKTNPEMLGGPPDVDTYVILCESDIPCRCQVIDINGAAVTVFAFDYGFTKKVHYRNLCWLQPGILKERFGKQAVCCQLKGFRSGTAYAKDLGLCLSILINLSRERSLLGPYFSKDEAIEPLIHLVLCPMSGLVRHSMRVLLNMSYDPVIMNKLCSWNYMHLLLDKVISCQKNPRDKMLDILHVSLETLANMLHKSPALQDKFTSASGLNLILNLINQDTDEYTSKIIGQILCNFIGSNKIRDVVAYEKNTRWRSLADVTDVERGFSVILPPQNRPSHRRTRSGSRGSADRSRSASRGRAGDSDAGYEASLLPSKLECRDSSTEDEGDFGITNKTSSDHSVSAKFAKGQRIVPDITNCEYFDALYAHDIELLQAIHVSVGFLNAGITGKMYTGILHDKVVGIRLNRDEKDRLRQGVDIMMKDKIEPMVYTDQYDINFHEIGRDLYVIEIEVRPAATKPLTCFRVQILGKTNRNYFIRNLNTGETERLSAQMLREQIITDKEARYLAEIAVLESELKLLN